MNLSEKKNASSFLLVCDVWKLLSCVQFFATPWTIHGILQARIQEWVAFSFSRGSSQPRDQTQVSHIAGRFFTKGRGLDNEKRKDVALGIE